MVSNTTVTKARKNRSRQLFSNVGWPTLSIITLAIAWLFMRMHPKIPFQYAGSANIYTGLLLLLSITCVILGTWKADYRWKFLNVAAAIIWLIPFTLYFMSFAGPLFVIDLSR